MLIVTLFIISKNWKQLVCPSTGEWITELRVTTELYNRVKH